MRGGRRDGGAAVARARDPAARVLARRRPARSLVAAGVWWRAGQAAAAAVALRGIGFDPFVVALAVAVLLAVAYELFLIVATPPNNWDSMHYHLARVAAWHAHRDLAYFPTQQRDRERVSAERGAARALDVRVPRARPARGAAAAARRSRHGGVRLRDRAAASATRAGSPRSRRCCLPTLTIVALESVTTQNDLVVASFVVAAVAFALGRTRAEIAARGSRGRARRRHEAHVRLRASGARRDRAARGAAPTPRGARGRCGRRRRSLRQLRIRPEPRRDRPAPGEGCAGQLAAAARHRVRDGVEHRADGVPARRPLRVPSARRRSRVTSSGLAKRVFDALRHPGESAGVDDDAGPSSSRSR